MLIKLKRLKILLESGYCNNVFRKSLHFSFDIRYKTKAYDQYLIKQREEALAKYAAKSVPQDIRAKGNIIIGN